MTSAAPLLEKLGADGAWLPSVKVVPGLDGSFVVDGQAEGDGDLPADRRRSGGTGADDHGCRRDRQVTSKAAGVVGAAAAWSAAVIILALPATAGAARFAVGLEPGASGASVAQRLRDRGARGLVDLAPIPAFAVSAPSAAVLRDVPGALYVEQLRPRRVAYVPNDPFLPRQWYAAQNRAFDAWLEPPLLASVRVAVIDSGVDGGASGARRPDRRLEELRSRPGDRRHSGPRDVRRRPDRGPDERRHRARGARATCRAPDREGRRPAAVDRRRGRGEGDPLGGRERSADHQHEPRWSARSEQPGSGHLLAARGGRGRVRGVEGSARRGGRRQLRPVTVPTVAVCKLAGGTPARARRQCAQSQGRLARASRTAIPVSTTSQRRARTSCRPSRAG